MRSIALTILLALAPAVRGATLLDDSAEVDPGAVDLARRAAVYALRGEPTALADLVRESEALDEMRCARDLAPTGLTDDVRLLGAGLRPTRDARRDALEEVIDARPDDVVERFARHALEHDDDAGAADQLLADD
ncbi:MAG: hypothetical protein ACREQL_01565, partial [Candidatus Binatia bacterium]